MQTRILAVAAIALTTAGCGLKDNAVVVLPEADGKVGAVVVHAKAGPQVVLNKPFSSAQAWRGGDMAAVDEPVEKEMVERVFRAALAAKPMPAKSFVLYFQQGTTTLTAASEPILPDIFAEMRRRPAAEVTVTGHTDAVGRGPVNDALSLDRARAVRDFLIGKGIAPEVIDVAGRGERDLLVKTPDEVPEARNRRVEITVR